MGVEEETMTPELLVVKNISLPTPALAIVKVPVAVSPATLRLPEKSPLPWTERLVEGVAVAIPKNPVSSILAASVRMPDLKVEKMRSLLPVREF